LASKICQHILQKKYSLFIFTRPTNRCQLGQQHSQKFAGGEGAGRRKAIYVTLRPCDGLGVVGCADIVCTRTDSIKFLAVAYRAHARRIMLCSANCPVAEMAVRVSQVVD